MTIQDEQIIRSTLDYLVRLSFDNHIKILEQTNQVNEIKMSEQYRDAMLKELEKLFQTVSK